MYDIKIMSLKSNTTTWQNAARVPRAKQARFLYIYIHVGFGNPRSSSYCVNKTILMLIIKTQLFASMSIGPGPYILQTPLGTPFLF